MNFLAVVQTGLSFGTIFTICWIFFSILLTLALSYGSSRVSVKKKAYPNEELENSGQAEKALHVELNQKQPPFPLPRISIF